VSYRISRLSPLTSTRVKFAVPLSTAPDDFRNVQLLRSWFEYDSQLDMSSPRRGIDWNVILGLLLMAGISGGFWTSAAWLVARFWK
jgi:hypothetical protein